VWHVLIGRPLRFSEAAKEQITPIEGLSALSLDALTSVAYGPEAILIVLAGGGLAALRVMLPVTVAIVVLLAILVFSYRQVIDAYPGGGGAYAVAKDNFPRGVSLLAGAALIVDYTLTVAVSIAAGVAALSSAFPGLRPLTVPLCLGILALITLLNLRGVAEGARAFLLPTVLFIVGLLAVLAVGLVHPLAAHAPQPGRSLVATSGLETVGVLLVLRAFAAGCSALTGVEAIANGVPLFRQPRAARAKRTELLLGVILGAMLLGVAVLVQRFGIEPRVGQTALSQVIAASVGRGWAYYLLSVIITVVLALAANTSFGGLPVLASLLARDSYLPHLFALRGDRLVFGNGIWALAIMSGALLVAVGGNVNSLIPLFAIGVFIGFTISQSGLVVHWRRTRGARWRRRAAMNTVGAIATGISTIVFLVAKFTEGAWVVVIAIPLFIVLFTRIAAYYQRERAQLALGEVPAAPQGRRTLVIVPVANVSRLTAEAIGEAESLGQEVIAVTVAFDEEEDEGQASRSGTRGAFGHGVRITELEREWRRWHPGVPLRVLHTPYSSVVQPIVEFIDELRAKRTDQIVVLIPFVVPDHPWHWILHNQLDHVLSRALRSRTDVIVARVSASLSEPRNVGETGGKQSV
jgi:amino acid transporter